MMDEFRNLPSYLELDKFSTSKTAIMISLSTPLKELEIEQEKAYVQLQMEQQMTPLSRTSSSQRQERHLKCPEFNSSAVLQKGQI